jgi:hypothetical protein
MGSLQRHSQDPRVVLGMIAEPTGTDGFRLLSHQFFPSSLPALPPIDSGGEVKNDGHSELEDVELQA